MWVWFSQEERKDFRKWENGGGKYYHDMGKSVNIQIGLTSTLNLLSVGLRFVGNLAQNRIRNFSEDGFGG